MKGDGILFTNETWDDLPDCILKSAFLSLVDFILLVFVSIGKPIFGVLKSSELVAFAFLKTTTIGMGACLSCPAFGPSGLIVQAFAADDSAPDTSDDSLPGMLLANLAKLVSVVGESSTKESTGCSVLPHVNSSPLSTTNCTSWHVSGAEACWEAISHQPIEWSANWLLAWWLWM